MNTSSLTPILLLIASNAFMTVAWYGHLKFQGVPLWQAIGVSWGIAFFEYCLMVPANRWGVLSGNYSATELKIIQEAITLIVFWMFATIVLREKLRWNHYVAFLMVFGAVALARLPARKAQEPVSTLNAPV